MPDEIPNAGRQDPSADQSTLTAAPGLIQAQLTARPGDRFGRYKILEEIGQGGCGAVFVAEQEEPVRRRVALKVIKLGMDTRQVIARFEAERQALAMMDHPNIAKVLDAGATDTGRPFFVMELVRGVKITDYCDQHKLSTADRLKLFIQVCQAVQHAHQKGIIHRDLKPSNILVTLHDGVPTPKVIDFGIAKATANQKLTDKTVFTAFEQFIGTPAYMSPEQAEMSGLDIDTRSDIYSLGVLLYELLVGETPFSSEELLEVGLDAMRRILREKDPDRPSTMLSTMTDADLTATALHRQSEAPRLINSVRGDLDWIVMKCLEKDRTRRYDTANGLMLDIQRHLNHEPVLARPPSAAYRLQKSWRRNKVVFTAGALISAALVIGITVSSWQAVEASRARNAEKEQRLDAQTDRDKARAAQKVAEAARQAEKQERVLAETREAEADHLLYVANMNLALEAWEQNNFDQLRELLRETKASPDRGFEWYYWQRQTHLDLRTLRGHLGSVSCVAFSPNGLRLVTGSSDQTAKVWDAATGSEILTLTGHRALIDSVAFSPDGHRVVTGGEDQVAKLWSADTGQELLTFRGHHGPIYSVAFSPDGARIVTGSRDSTAKMWDAVSGRELLTFKGHEASIYAAVFSPDGRQIATGSDDRTARLWDVESGRERVMISGHSDRIYSVGFSPDGQRIVTGSRDKTAKVWDVASGRGLLSMKGHADWVRCVAFSPDGQWIATGSYDQTARIWEAATGLELLTLKGHRSQIYSVAFSPDGRWLLTGSEDQTARLWQWESAGGQERLTLKGHSAGINSVAFSLDRQRIVTAGDSTPIVWEAATGRQLLMLKEHQGPVYSVAISPDGQRIATGGDDQTARIWDAASGHELLTLRGHSAWVASVAFSPDCKRLVTGSGDHTAVVWELASGEQLLRLKGHSDRLRSVAFSPDGQRIVTGSDDGTAKIWDAASGRELLTLKGHTSAVNAVAFTPDGQRIVTGGYDQSAKVWEAHSGRELLVLNGHRGEIWAVACSPDGKRIATGSRDQTAKLWEATTGREVLTLKGHSSGINAIAFSADGRQLVTGSDDHTAKLWEASTVEQVNAWEEQERDAGEHLSALRYERAVEDGRWRLAASRDEGALKRWLILAPIALPTEQSGTEALDIEQIKDEGLLRPRAGEAKPVTGATLNWEQGTLQDYVIDFNEILGREMPHSVAYAVCYVLSDSERRGLQILLGSDDESKVYLNGKEIYKCSSPRSFIVEQDTVPNVTLKAGLNTLVFKVVNETKDWKGSLRLTDSSGNPVTGIRVTLNPAAKDYQ
jgi:WD40 repeat protein/serine/threonine protein kinase